MGMLALMYLIGCFHGEASSLALGVTPCQLGGACDIIGVAAGVGESDFDQGQKLDDLAAGAARCDDIAIDAGSARTVVAAKPSALTAAGIDLRQVLYMAVLLDVVDRRHPCRRLIDS
jgi:hypothetical protein